MRLKTGFHLLSVCGEKVLLAEGQENIDYSKIVNLNETAAYLWENLTEQNFEVEDMVSLLMKEYDVTDTVAYEDCQTLLRQWVEAGLAE